MQHKPRIILGVDPGCITAGFGILKSDGFRSTLLDYGALSMSSASPLPQRVMQFHDFFKEKIITYGVTHLALETPFLGKNAQNFLKLGYLRGILYLLSQQHGIEIQEFAPRQIKLALTGFGGADKEQVARVVCRLFPALVMPNKLDITDALAITVCGLWQGNSRFNNY